MQTAVNINSQESIKIFSLKNRIVTFAGFLLAFLLVLLIFKENWMNQVNRLFLHNAIFYSIRVKPITLKMLLFGSGLLLGGGVWFASRFPHVLLTEKELKMGFKIQNIPLSPYEHTIPWEKIVRIDSGGNRMIQWSPTTSIFYHTGKIPLGHSTDIKEAVLSNSLGQNNYCKILRMATQKAKHAQIDPLTFQLIENCRNSGAPVRHHISK
ncbi:MAG TPA: hypothetical protein VN944_07745 [Nitrospiria bacterium]|nr:hypothetical protein [Nitrospiria bacterium]